MVKEWRVLARECDGACYIYLKNRRDRELAEEVRRLLCRWKEEERSGLEQFFEQPQIRNMGANGDLRFYAGGKGRVFLPERVRRAVPAGGLRQRPCTRPPTGILPTKENYQTILFLPRDRTLSRGPESAACAWWTRARCWPKSWASALEDTDGRVPGGLLRED